MRRLRGTFTIVAINLVACTDGSVEPAPEPHDPARVFEVRSRTRTYRDEPFGFEVVTQLRTRDVLEDLDVRNIAVAGDAVYAGTASGLFRAAGDRFERVLIARTGTAAIDDLVVIDGGVLLAAGGAAVQLDARGAPAGVVELGITGRVRAIAPAGGGAVYAAGEHGLVRVSATGSSTITAASALEIRDLAVEPGGVLWIAARSGVFRLLNETVSPVAGPWSEAEDARALAPGEGAMWVASRSVLAEVSLDGATVELMRPERGGLPAADLRAVAAADGEVMVGHGIGASAVGALIEHYHSLRWIPAEEVRGVAIGADRTRWIATAGGVSRIAFVPWTLLEKAEDQDADIARDHIRMDGFVDDIVGFEDPYDHSAGARHWDNDNDGLWTEMQIGTWCMAFAATGEERYREQARRSLQVMLLQIDVPGETFAAVGRSRGFITRSLVRDDEEPNFSSKAMYDNWHRQDFGGRTYYWKGDTSSDEYAGHYFGLPLYFDLCAEDEAEREQIRTRIRLATDYVIEGGYKLIDLDGEPTSFGRWDNLAASADGLDGCPERYDLATCLNSWGGGGWLNSLEVLGMLLATWHITGDEKYYAEYERLYTDEKYGRMIPPTEDTLTITSPRFANHSDHELATLAYFTLLRYEPNADRRALIVQSFLDFFEHEREEHNPWQIAVLALYHEPDVDLDGAIKSLRDMPLDRRHWEINNEHRLDAGRWPPDRHDNPQFDRCFPYDEINALKWNANPYNVSDGWSGAAVLSPTPYLISYWTARYAGLIE